MDNYLHINFFFILLQHFGQSIIVLVTKPLFVTHKTKRDKYIVIYNISK